MLRTFAVDAGVRMPVRKAVALIENGDDVLSKDGSAPPVVKHAGESSSAAAATAASVSSGPMLMYKWAPDATEEFGPFSVAQMQEWQAQVRQL